jgi:hypothetical protein
VSDQPLAPTGTPTWKITAAVALIMVVLALLGIGLATTNPRLARNYWVSLVPIYGVLCVVTAWRRSQQSGERLVLRQVLHWLGIAGFVALDFYIRGTGVETQVSAGLNSLMLLALGCLLAGVHLDWSFLFVGLLLTLTLFVVAKADQYLWLLFVVGALVIAALFAAHRVWGGSDTPNRGAV